MKINEIQANQIITKSGLPATDFVINPYVGCMHSCIYCYARFMKRFTGHEEEWGTFVDVKINAPELIPAEKKGAERFRGKSIFLSSVTDPYLTLERKYHLTRKILEKLILLQPELGIQTKSDLVLRDIDLIKQFKDCEVGMTITSDDDKIRQEIEPFTSPVEDRISALKKLKEEGIKTYVFIGPIMPFITDWKKIVAKTRHYSVVYMFENLNIKGPVWGQVQNWLKKKHPDLLEKYEKIYFSKNDYWENVENEIRQFCKSEGIDCRIYFHHKAKS